MINPFFPQYAISTPLIVFCIARLLSKQISRFKVYIGCPLVLMLHSNHNFKKKLVEKSKYYIVMAGLADAYHNQIPSIPRTPFLCKLHSPSLNCLIASFSPWWYHLFVACSTFYSNNFQPQDPHAPSNTPLS